MLVCGDSVENRKRCLAYFGGRLAYIVELETLFRGCNATEYSLAFIV